MHKVYHYFSYLELAGAKVIPIIHDTSKEKLIPLLDKINGVLFTGGGLELVDKETKEYHIYTQTSELIYNYSITHTDQGDYFPLIGICQGFQLFNILQSETKLVLKHSYSALTLNDYLLPFLANYKESRWFSQLGEDKEWVYSHQKLVINLHDWGVYLGDYLYNRKELSEFFRVISYEEDDDRRFIVTAIEAYHYPIYGVQFHPERTFYRYTDKDNYKRTPEARMLSEDLIFYFVEETRKSKHYFEVLEDLNKHMNECQTRAWGYVSSTEEFVQPIFVNKTCLGYD